MTALFVASLLAGLSAVGTEDLPSEAADEEARDVAEWSVLVYLVADNDLDPYTEEDFQELKDGDSSASVNVLVLVDRLYEPAYLYCIEDHEMVELKSLGEVNMGDPATLTDFVEYSDTYFPAEHMLLFFWDHGTPTGGVGVDTTMEGDEPGTSWDWLSHHEMMAALEGYHMDIIACDECSIGQMETLYEYVSNGLSVDYMVASESYIGWRGFSYDKIVQRLILNPEMEALELCTIIVEEFTNLFNQPPYMSEMLTTQSIFNMSKIAALGEAVTAMAGTLAGDIDSYRQIIGAAQRSSIIPWGARGESWIDMPSFVEQIMENVKKGDPAYAACEAVLDAYGEAMLGMGTAKNSELYGYNGMGITFPASHSSYTIAYADSEWGGYETYMTFEFPNMGWWEFLQTYWGFE
ncbi:MAG: clostripain-related cysteine peptidase [Thermoplasmata archaeon]|nr:clostripain-related cysteine peptidase [Thermoplasmata archaeon]